MPGISKQELKQLNTPQKAAETPIKANEAYVEVGKYIAGRVEAMKTWRKSLKIEQEWKEADAEYLPRELTIGTGRKRFETDQDNGLRSRLVEVTREEDWRSTNSDPTLLVKIQTAMSIIIDRDPQATFEALIKRFEGTEAIVKALWRRNWSVTNAKDKMKLFVFDLAKYGWAAGRTYPRRVEQDKKILTKYYADNPERNEYEQKKLLWFNDLDRERLDPYRTWIDEMTKPYDQYSMNDCYYEVDYGEDQFRAEFGAYYNAEQVKASQKVTDDNVSTEQQQEDVEKKKVVTLGFYESRLKDLFGIVVPRQNNMVLTYSPLPNDDGMLSVWHTPWILRSSSSPFGIGLWRIIKQDKELYDKMMNMTMNQLVLSIEKMFFYTGSAGLVGDGKLKIEPGKGKQIINGKVDWLEVPGPGADSWKGLASLKEKIDSNSGVTPTLMGEIGTNNTLGETLHAKESALKRMRMPVENIVSAIEQDAYISVSWFPQLYSVPEVVSFVSREDIRKYEEETGFKAQSTFEKLDEAGNPEGPIEATFRPQFKLNLEKKGNDFIESKAARFFQIGEDVPLDTLRWRGVIRVEQKSIISASSELDKQRTLEIFNLLVPLLVMPPQLAAKPAEQVLKANDQEPEDWLPDEWVDYLRNKNSPAPSNGQQLFVQGSSPLQQGLGAAQQASGGQSMQGALNVTPNEGAQTVVPRSQIQGAEIPGVTANMGRYTGKSNQRL